MAETKRKRNTRTLKAHEGFQISKEPVVRGAVDDGLQNIGGGVGLPRAYGAPIFFAIARDPHCIFAGWNIDWLSVFEKAMPVDRQVHLRVHRADGVEEKSVAVEPMAGMHYVTTSEQGSYRVELGYYQPADVWHSIAMSNEIVMPPRGITEAADVDLVTVPFHLSFQQLVGLFGPASDTELAAVMSRFQKRALSSKERTRLSPYEKRILRRLDVSLPGIAAARRAFDEIDAEKLVKLSGGQPAWGATSPSGEFGESSWS